MKYEEVLEEERGPRVPRSRVPMDQEISKSHSNTSLTQKKVFFVSSSDSVEDPLFSSSS